MTQPLDPGDLDLADVGFRLARDRFARYGQDIFPGDFEPAVSVARDFLQSEFYPYVTGYYPGAESTAVVSRRALEMFYEHVITASVVRSRNNESPPTRSEIASYFVSSRAFFNSMWHTEW